VRLGPYTALARREFEGSFGLELETGELITAADEKGCALGSTISTWTRSELWSGRSRPNGDG
jgi:hypothetical protein